MHINTKYNVPLLVHTYCLFCKLKYHYDCSFYSLFVFVFVFCCLFICPCIDSVHTTLLYFHTYSYWLLAEKVAGCLFTVCSTTSIESVNVDVLMNSSSSSSNTSTDDTNPAFNSGYDQQQ